MDKPIQPASNGLGLQLSLLDELAQSLRAAQSAMLTSDLPSFEAHTARQWTLCQALMQERAAVDSASQDQEADVNRTRQAADLPRQVALLAQVRRMEDRVRQLNRVHACLLRRAQRSLALLRHIVASQCPTYGPAIAAESQKGGE
ncbi:MAG TPA: hypothetical protein VFA68_01340 [Terriglobales bacterium]|nr:hypothetical protein [Terriglobales bacterium]